MGMGMPDENDKKEYLTTEEHFDIFKKECNRWAREYELGDWDLRIFHETDMNDSRASVWINSQDRVAYVYLSREWDVEPDELLVKRSAFHEVWEIILGDIQCVGKSRYITESQFASAVHGVVRRMENCVFDKHYRKVTEEDGNESIILSS